MTNRPHDSDAELIRRASAGDPDAFCAVFDRYAEPVHAWLLGAGAGEQAADLLAETFARAWVSRDRFRDRAGGSARPWLLGIARNLLREAFRSRRVDTAARQRLGMRLELAAEGGYEAVDEELSPGEATAAVRGLAPHERDAVELRVVEGLPYDEVAERLDIRPAAARLRVSRALGRLRQTTTRETPS